MYQFLYYLLYKDFRSFKINTTPEMSAFFLTSTVQSLHILTLVLVIFSGTKFVNETNIVIFYVLFLFFDYFFLTRRFKKIMKKYDEKYGKKKWLHKLSFIFVLINNIGCLFLVKYL